MITLKTVESANKAAIERALRTKEPALVHVSFVDEQIHDFCIAGEGEKVPEGYEELGKMIPTQEKGIEWSCKFLYAIADYT